jgi:hypothetical protein
MRCAINFDFERAAIYKALASVLIAAARTSLLEHITVHFSYPFKRNPTSHMQAINILAADVPKQTRLV